MNSPLIAVKDLSTATHDGRILSQSLNFSVSPGQIILVSGPNGIGKSTLLKTLIGNLKPKQGKIELNLPFSKIGYLPQLQNTDFHLPVTLRDILEASCHHSLSVDEILSWKLLSEAQLDLSWKTASGGERKRTLLTRTLLAKPDILVLDEPMNHLDVQTRLLVESAIQKFVELPQSNGRKRAVLLVSHEKSLNQLVHHPNFSKILLAPQSPSSGMENEDAE
jgi:ATPase subunit of ABC transporter with duplicated ATPase domains